MVIQINAPLCGPRIGNSGGPDSLGREGIKYPLDAERLVVAQNTDDEASSLENLIHAVSSIEERNMWGITAQKNGEIIEKCIKDGVDLNARNKYGLTPIMYAQTPYTVAVLINNGANPNARDTHGRTALMMAINSGRVNVAETLVSEGADLNVRDNHGRTAIMYALSSVGTGLALSADLIKVMVKAGADVNLTDNTGVTPLLEARSPEIAKILVDAGADPNKAAAIYSAENINAGDEAGRTPLMQAAVRGNSPLIRALISKGAQIDLQDKKGDTALMLSVFYDHRRNLLSSSVSDNLEAIKALVDAGADVCIKNNDGKTALDYTQGQEFAKMPSSEAVVKVLSDK